MLITLTPILFNFRDVFSIGIFNEENDFTNSYSDGTAGINVQLHFEHFIGSNQRYSDRYSIDTFIEPISTGDVDNLGFISIDSIYLNDGS